MADSIDENAGVTPGEEPADAASTEEFPTTEASADGQAAAAEARLAGLNKAETAEPGI